MTTKLALLIFAAATIIICATSLKISEDNEEKRQMNYKLSSAIDPKKTERNQEVQGRHGQKSEPKIDFKLEIENEEVNSKYAQYAAVNSFKEPRNLPCPDEYVIFPCTCSLDESNNIFMDCSHVTTEAELKTIFEQPFPFSAMYNFYMDQYNVNSNIIGLSDGIFNTKTFQVIAIKNVNFGFNLNILDGMNSTLEEIYLDNVPLTSLNKNFNIYTQLNIIEIENTPLVDAYIISPTLRYLYFHSTNLRERNAGENLKLGIMENLDILEVTHSSLSLIPDISGYMSLAILRVFYNNIAVLDTSMDPELFILNARNNLIADIDTGSIKVTKGGEVYLDTNQLTTLDEENWMQIFINASVVGINSNPLECGCDIAWLFGSDPDLTPFMYKFSQPEYTTCKDGERLTELDPELFQDCP